MGWNSVNSSLIALFRISTGCFERASRPREHHQVRHTRGSDRLVLFHDRSDRHTIALDSAVIKHLHFGFLLHRARPVGARTERGVLRVPGRSQPLLTAAHTALLRVPAELSPGRLVDRARLRQRTVSEADLLSHGQLLAEKGFPCEVPVQRRLLLPLREAHPIVQLEPAEPERSEQAGEDERIGRSDRRTEAHLVSGQPHAQEPLLLRGGANAVLRTELSDRSEDSKALPIATIYRDGELSNLEEDPLDTSNDPALTRFSFFPHPVLPDSAESGPHSAVDHTDDQQLTDTAPRDELPANVRADRKSVV